MADRLYGHKTWRAILDETISSIGLLCNTKGQEYAASDTDQLANFRRRSDRFGLPMEAAWVLYAGKHWDALETYVRDLIENKTRERSEPLEGRVDDLIVYLVLFKAMLAERAAAAVKPCPGCSATTLEAIEHCTDNSRPGCVQIPF